MTSVSALAGDGAAVLDVAVSALEDLRKLDAWLAWAKLHVAAMTASAATSEHEHWVDANQGWFDDEEAFPGGLSRAQRMAVGERSGIAEIAAALRISESAASMMLDRAELLTSRLPRTGEALRAGTISGPAAAAITDATAEYVEHVEADPDPVLRAAFERAIETTEQALLPAAQRGDSTAKLTARARRVRDACHPFSFAQRHRAALADRYVAIRPQRDGMASLCALLPAAVAYGIDRRLSMIAGQLQESCTAGHGSRDDEAGNDESGNTGFGDDDGGRSGENGARGSGDHDGGRSGESGALVSVGAPGAPAPCDERRTCSQLRADVLADLLGGLDGGLDGDLAGVSDAGRCGDRPDTADPGETGVGSTKGRGGLKSTASASSPSNRARASSGRPSARSSDPTGGGTGVPTRASNDNERVAPHLTLTVPAETLLGADAPGVLGRFGPVAAEDARRLAALATSFTLAVITRFGPDRGLLPAAAPPTGIALQAGSAPPSGTAPPTGTALQAGSASPTGTARRTGCAPSADAGRLPAAPWGVVPSLGTVVPVAWTSGEKYRLPRALRRALAMRDATCRFPGCRRTAERCDVDHVVAWADGGRSTIENLAHLCRTHHVLKHHSAWSVDIDGRTADAKSQRPAGEGRPGVPGERETLVWISPSGRRYLSDPEPPPF